MTTLHDRLADLADTAPDAPPDPDLWGRGQRYGRQRRVAVAALASAALLAVTTGVLAWQPAREGVEPTQSDGLRLPDRLWRPDPWAPDIEQTGPLGPLVATIDAPRDGWGNLDLTAESEVAGVNAAGDYAFLSLDDRVGGEVELSPDGRYLAYWYASGSTGRGDVGYDAADGIAVLDAVEGDTRRHRVDTDLGLQPEQLSWAGERLWVPLWPYDERTATTSSSRLTSTLLWDMADAAPSEVAAAGLGDVGGLPAFGDDLVDVRRNRLVLIAPDGTRRALERVQGALDGPAHLDPTGTRVVGLRSLPADDRPHQAQLVVGTRTARARDGLRLLPVPDAIVDGIVGWRSDREVVTSRWTDDGAIYESVDVVTGERSALVRPPAQAWGSDDRFAADALAAPSFVAPRPPDLRDPRQTALAGLGAAAVVAGGAFLLWRRRVRA